MSKLWPFIIAIFLTGCATDPVDRMHWNQCTEACWPDKVSSACVSFWLGEMCSCVGKPGMIELKNWSPPYMSRGY
jgi:hypothetical protein